MEFRVTDISLAISAYKKLENHKRNYFYSTLKLGHKKKFHDVSQSLLRHGKYEIDKYFSKIINYKFENEFDYSSKVLSESEFFKQKHDYYSRQELTNPISTKFGLTQSSRLLELSSKFIYHLDHLQPQFIDPIDLNIENDTSKHSEKNKDEEKRNKDAEETACQNVKLMYELGIITMLKDKFPLLRNNDKKIAELIQFITNSKHKLDAIRKPIANYRLIETNPNKTDQIKMKGEYKQMYDSVVGPNSDQR